MKTDYQLIKITKEQAASIALEFYNIEGKITQLPGELDFNFRITSDSESYILKISRPGEDPDYIDYQQALLSEVAPKTNITSPEIIRDKQGNLTSTFIDQAGNKRLIRLLTWTHGRLWSSVNPISDELLHSLGQEAGNLCGALVDFDHPQAHRTFEWDVAQANWTPEYFHLFNPEQRDIATYFSSLFNEHLEAYSQLRKSVVHNDANDNNVVVSEDLINPKVEAIIDYGDAIYTQIINDAAIAIAYAVMHKPDPLSAACHLLRGYHSGFPLKEEELIHLYYAVAMRLIISVTKSAINKEKEPDNEYLLISEKPAWEVLYKWRNISPSLALHSFRNACGFTPVPNQDSFYKWALNNKVLIEDIFPELKCNQVKRVDMSVSSTWLGHRFEYEDLDYSAYKLQQLQKEAPDSVIAGGYLETRPFYSTEAYQIEGNNGPEYRTVHLGTDFWVKEQTKVHSPFDAKVIAVCDNNFSKDYGPTVILEHTYNDEQFYTLFGHLSKDSLSVLSEGQIIQKGELIGYVGNSSENGEWVPHLHFQIMLDLLGNTTNFPGVATPNAIELWRSICPDPNWLFQLSDIEPIEFTTQDEILTYRKKHLGKSLSVSYDQPLSMVRGAGAFLIDKTGRKYLDTVNNVAHVGHEHQNVVQAGQKQMALLNTNTRYLHENINEFAQELLKTFPNELSVVHFVNSGSEANELALRMAKAASGGKDIVAVEIGYHGNTNACIDVSSYKFDGKGGSGAPEHTHIVPLPDTYRGLYRGNDTAAKYAAHVYDKLSEIEAKGRKTAAFICESIISCGGQIELPENYLKLAYKAVRKAGGVCISDEVQVGCGRVGKTFWGFQLHDVIPDIVTIGKPIGNGHPLAAVVCTPEVAEAFANGMEYFNTFGGNPVSCAIGTEVLRTIQADKLQENALVVGEYLKSELQRLSIDFPIIGNIRGQGLFLGFELVDQSLNPLANKASYLANRMKTLGILMSTDGKDNNVLKIKPPLVFSKENASELVKRLEQIFNEDFMKL